MMSVRRAVESREFYELMQAYRHCAIYDQASVIAAFEAVKQFVAALDTSAGETPQTLHDCPDCPPDRPCGCGRRRSASPSETPTIRPSAPRPEQWHPAVEAAVNRARRSIPDGWTLDTAPNNENDDLVIAYLADRALPSAPQEPPQDIKRLATLTSHCCCHYPQGQPCNRAECVGAIVRDFLKGASAPQTVSTEAVNRLAERIFKQWPFMPAGSETTWIASLIESVLSVSAPPQGWQHIWPLVYEWRSALLEVRQEKGEAISDDASYRLIQAEAELKWALCNQTPGASEAGVRPSTEAAVSRLVPNGGDSGQSCQHHADHCWHANPRLELRLETCCWCGTGRALRDHGSYMAAEPPAASAPPQGWQSPESNPARRIAEATVDKLTPLLGRFPRQRVLDDLFEWLYSQLLELQRTIKVEAEMVGDYIACVDGRHEHCWHPDVTQGRDTCCWCGTGRNLTLMHGKRILGSGKVAIDPSLPAPPASDREEIDQ